MGIRRGIRNILEKNAFTTDEIATKMQISLDEALLIVSTDTYIADLTKYEAIKKFIIAKARNKRWKFNKLDLLADPTLDDKLFTLKKKNQTFQNIVSRGQFEYDLRASEMKRSVVDHSNRIKEHHDKIVERVMQLLIEDGYTLYTSLMMDLVPDGLCKKTENTLSVEVKVLPKDPLLKIVREVDSIISALKYISEFDNCWLLYNRSEFIPTVLSELGHEGNEFTLKSIPYLFVRCMGKIGRISQEEIEMVKEGHSADSGKKFEIYGELSRDLRKATRRGKRNEDLRYQRKRLGEIKGFMASLRRSYEKFESRFMPQLANKEIRCYLDSTPRFEGDKNLIVTLNYHQIFKS